MKHFTTFQEKELGSVPDLEAVRNFLINVSAENIFFHCLFWFSLSLFYNLMFFNQGFMNCNNYFFKDIASELSKRNLASCTTFNLHG